MGDANVFDNGKRYVAEDVHAAIVAGLEAGLATAESRADLWEARATNNNKVAADLAATASSLRAQLADLGARMVDVNAAYIKETEENARLRARLAEVEGVEVAWVDKSPHHIAIIRRRINETREAIQVIAERMKSMSGSSSIEDIIRSAYIEGAHRAALKEPPHV